MELLIILITVLAFIGFILMVSAFIAEALLWGAVVRFFMVFFTDPPKMKNPPKYPPEEDPETLPDVDEIPPADPEQTH